VRRYAEHLIIAGKGGRERRVSRNDKVKGALNGRLAASERVNVMFPSHGT